MGRLFKRRSRSFLLPVYLLSGLCALVFAVMEPAAGGSLLVFLAMAVGLLIAFYLRLGPVALCTIMGAALAILLPALDRSLYAQVAVVLSGGVFGLLMGLLLDALSREKTYSPIEDVPADGNPFAPPPKAPAKTPEKVYSVPRRYDLSMMLTAFVGYALMFGTMQGLHAHPAVFIVVALFVTSIGVGQALLYGGENPRKASQVVGAVFCFITCTVVAAIYGKFCVFIPGAILGTVLGIVLGYVGGVLVGGVFLVADALRKLAARLRGNGE